MATRDGLAQIWYADANGVITGYTPTADNVASAIIDAYNEHYGTDINIWTPETKNLQVGDTVPNWNAYEKIGIPRTYIAVTIGGNDGPFAFGELKDNEEIVFECYQENVPWAASTAGNIVVKQYGFPQVFTDMWKPKIDAALGINSTASTMISSLNIGDTVPNWANYQKII